jgi:putative hydrolase of HD superfamily
MKDIENILNFIIEIEKLKAVSRKTKPVGLNRYENSAEHSWHVCLSALMLREYANDEIDIDRVIRMLLIHDLGEIDAGDTIVYAADNEETKNREMAGMKRILAILPDSTASQYFDLWNEFESGESADSKYARAIDRVPPILHNLHGDGHSWRDNNVPKEKVFSVNSRIKDGSQKLWDVIESKLEVAVTDGLLK